MSQNEQEEPGELERRIAQPHTVYVSVEHKLTFRVYFEEMGLDVFWDFEITTIDLSNVKCINVDAYRKSQQSTLFFCTEDASEELGVFVGQTTSIASTVNGALANSGGTLANFTYSTFCLYQECPSHVAYWRCNMQYSGTWVDAQFNYIGLIAGWANESLQFNFSYSTGMLTLTDFAPSVAMFEREGFTKLNDTTYCKEFDLTDSDVTDFTVWGEPQDVSYFDYIRFRITFDVRSGVGSASGFLIVIPRFTIVAHKVYEWYILGNLVYQPWDFSWSVDIQSQSNGRLWTSDARITISPEMKAKNYEGEADPGISTTDTAFFTLMYQLEATLDPSDQWVSDGYISRADLFNSGGSSVANAANPINPNGWIRYSAFRTTTSATELNWEDKKIFGYTEEEYTIPPYRDSLVVSSNRTCVDIATTLKFKPEYL